MSFYQDLTTKLMRLEARRKSIVESGDKIAMICLDSQIEALYHAREEEVKKSEFPEILSMLRGGLITNTEAMFKIVHLAQTL